MTPDDLLLLLWLLLLAALARRAVVELARHVRWLLTNRRLRNRRRARRGLVT